MPKISNTGGHSEQVNYFLKDPEKLESEDQTESIKAFVQFVDYLSQNPHFSINLEDGEYNPTKDAVAFYIEAAKQLYEEDWKNKLQEIIDAIDHIRSKCDSEKGKTDEEKKEQAYKCTTWLLNKIINDLYLHSVQIHQIKSTSKTEKNFYTTLMQSTVSIKSGNDYLETLDQAVDTLGSVSRRLLPQWYRSNYITPSTTTASIEKQKPSKNVYRPLERKASRTL